MDYLTRRADIEALARMAARLAGRDPDEQVEMTLGGKQIFEGSMWRYPDFLARAEAALDTLTYASLTLPPSLSEREAGVSPPAA